MPDAEPEYPPITSLDRVQRRVLGVLIEKGFTTPDQYPLTLKAVTSGCNQKNNRDPLTNYDEDQVEQALDALRELGLAAVVHTESGRTERYRHWMRKRFPDLSEGELAILGELLLRGRQQVGELRGRASRMHAIDSLEQLRSELETLRRRGWVQTDGPLERRGAEVDHNWYQPREGQTLSQRPPDAEPADPAPRPASPVASSLPPARPAPAPVSIRVSPDLSRRIETLEAIQRELRDEIAQLRDAISRLEGGIETLRRDLGG